MVQWMSTGEDAMASTTSAGPVIRVFDYNELTIDRLCSTVTLCLLHNSSVVITSHPTIDCTWEPDSVGKLFGSGAEYLGRPVGWQSMFLFLPLTPYSHSFLRCTWSRKIYQELEANRTARYHRYLCQGYVPGVHEETR